ncbi:MAG: hypothetical protein JWL59_3688 [Chthoniobacteraceae bacterium]|nr:hypothetical protein [Chthoniobacteraceae bacterium]
MNNDLQNKLNSHHAVLRVGEANEPIWKDKKPRAFSKKMAELISGVAEFERLAAIHNSDLAGIVLDKDAAQETLIGSILNVAGPMCSYFADKKDKTSLTKVNFTASDLRNSRDAALSQIAQIVLSLLKPLTRQKSALDDDYGINPATYSSLETDLKTYDEALGKPRAALASRKSATAKLLLRSSALDALYDEHLDHLVTSFAVTDEGSTFVSDWFNARKIINLGHGSSAPDPAEPAPPHAQALLQPAASTAAAPEL